MGIPIHHLLGIVAFTLKSLYIQYMLAFFSLAPSSCSSVFSSFATLSARSQVQRDLGEYVGRRGEVGKKDYIPPGALAVEDVKYDPDVLLEIHLYTFLLTWG